MLLPLHPTENLLKISFWQPTRKHTLLSVASHQGFVRQACSEPRAFKTPIMQQDSAGQKEQECFRQSCGHTGIIHSSVALQIVCESYKQRGGLRRLQGLIIGSYTSSQILAGGFEVFFPPFLPLCVFEKLCAKAPLRR